MDSTRPEAAVNFIRALHRDTTGPVAFQTLPGADELTTRNAADIERFVRRAARGEMDAYHCPVALRAEADVAPGETILRSKRNAAKAPAAWTDIDAKDITLSLEDAAKILRALRFPPSFIVWSGNGLHAYWLLSEPFDVAEEQERFEALLRRLVDRFGGDPAPAHVAALMRLPGTHNRKHGVCKLVTVEGDGRRFHFEDLEEWLDEQPAVITRKPSATRPGGIEPESNPYLRAAREYNWKPTLDVDGELGRMAAGNIHHTCVRVSASLLRRGTPLEEVVARLLGEIARAKAEAGEAFQERREERRLRAMCRSWIVKHPVEHRKERKEERPVDEPGEVHEYEGARAKKKAKADPASGEEAGKDKGLHIMVSKGVLNAFADRGEAILFTRKAMWFYSGGLWSMMTDGAGAFLDVKIEECCVEQGLRSRNSLVKESRGWIMRQPALWRETIPWDQHGKIPTRSGLVDPDTLAIEPLSPEHSCTWRVETEFDPAATCPWWLQMLEDAFADRNAHDRAENIRVIQETAGCALIDAKPREMTKGLIIQGGQNTGKTGLLEVLSGLFGADPITSKLDSIDSAHGLMPFVRRAPWALHEAFEQSKWHFSANVKTIITGEPFAVNIKNGPIITVRYRGPLFWATNYPPQFKESTRAVIERFIVLHARRVFDPESPRVGAALEAARRGYSSPAELILATEMPGVLNWALAGFQRARAAGRISLNVEAKESGAEIHRDSNLVAEFVEDCIAFDRDMMVANHDFYTAFCAWWSEQRGSRNIPERAQVGKAISALGDARIGVNDQELRTTTERFYAGIILNSTGTEFHKQALAIPSLGERVGRATRDGVINRDIPAGWVSKSVVVRMREAHARAGAPVISRHFATENDAGSGPGSPLSYLPASARHDGQASEEYEENSFQ